MLMLRRKVSRIQVFELLLRGGFMLPCWGNGKSLSSLQGQRWAPPHSFSFCHSPFTFITLNFQFNKPHL